VGLTNLGQHLSSLLAPRRCAVCAAPLAPTGVAFLCSPCAGELPRIEIACRACGRDLGAHAAPSPRCGGCRSLPKGAVDTTTALWRYRGVARTTLRRLKYEGLEDLGQPLGRALGERVARVGADLDVPLRDLVVVPIPLHPWRRWRRGYNQAALLASAVGRVLDRPILEVLVRARATRALYGVPRRRRDEVVAGAFRARRRAARLLAGRPVLLVDDIRTSGATLRAAGQALLAVGAPRVDAAVVAR
jgi:ComF family protein